MPALRQRAAVPLSSASPLVSACCSASEKLASASF